MTPSARDYWDRHARQFDGLYDRPSWFDRHFRRAIYLRATMSAERMAQTPAPAVLDVGCGSGRNSVLFARQDSACRVLGVDLAEEMLHMASELADRLGVGDRCRFRQGDFLDMDLPEAPFDYSVALGVMDYFPDPTPVLRRMRQVTTREALATFPGLAPLRMTLRKVRYGLRGCGVYGFGRSAIEGMYRAAGFAACRVVRCTRAGWMGIGVV